MDRLLTRIRGQRIALMPGLVALIFVGGLGVGVAATTDHNGAGIAYAAVTASPTQGGTVSPVAIATGGNATVYTGQVWKTVGTVDISAPIRATIDVRFTAESTCYGTTGYCSLRVLIDGVETFPYSGLNFAFNQLGSSVGGQGLSVERLDKTRSTGTHRVAVQAASAGLNSDVLPYWTLRAEVLTP
jgi:hypothetical protein